MVSPRVSWRSSCGLLLIATGAVLPLLPLWRSHGVRSQHFFFWGLITIITSYRTCIMCFCAWDVAQKLQAKERINFVLSFVDYHLLAKRAQRMSRGELYRRLLLIAVRWLQVDVGLCAVLDITRGGRGGRLAFQPCWRYADALQRPEIWQGALVFGLLVDGVIGLFDGAHSLWISTSLGLQHSPQHRYPQVSRTLRELWGRRWNAMFANTFRALAGVPRRFLMHAAQVNDGARWQGTHKTIGERKKISPKSGVWTKLRSALFVFTLSGVLHAWPVLLALANDTSARSASFCAEDTSVTLSAGAAFERALACAGMMMAFFLLQAVGIAASALLPRLVVMRWLWLWLWLVATAPLFMLPAQRAMAHVHAGSVTGMLYDRVWP